MRIALISDMHANAIAFDAVLSDLDRGDVDQLVCLGDTIQGGAQPRQVCRRLRSLACPVVLGNADEFVLSGSPGIEAVTPGQREVREWTLSQFEDVDLEFMRGFQPTVTVDGDTQTILLAFHGSPLSFDDLILPWAPTSEIRHFLPDAPPPFMAGGHTHLQQFRRIGESIFVNPGTIGLAFETTTNGCRAWAEYAVLSYGSKTTAVEFRRVEYDPAEYARSILASGRPHAQELAAGFQPTTKEPDASR